MSKRHEAILLPSADKENITKATEKSKLMEKKFESYCRKLGIEKSCHIEREHGPDISIMTEIVSQQKKECFPEELSSDSSASASSFEEDKVGKNDDEISLNKKDPMVNNYMHVKHHNTIKRSKGSMVIDTKSLNLVDDERPILTSVW